MTRTDDNWLYHCFLVGLLASLPAACSLPESAPDTPSIDMLHPSQHEFWEKTVFGGEGEVVFSHNAVELDFGNSLTGITWRGHFPRQDYCIEFDATRLDGDDFFCCLTFPVGDSQLSLVLGGWGGTTSGMSCIDAKDASENETTCYLTIEQGHRYPVCLRVEGERVQAWFNGKLHWELDSRGRMLSIRPEVELSQPLGIASFSTRARIENLRWRPL